MTRHHVALQELRRDLAVAEAHGIRIITATQAAKYRALLTELDAAVDRLLGKKVA